MKKYVITSCAIIIIFTLLMLFLPVNLNQTQPSNLITIGLSELQPGAAYAASTLDYNCDGTDDDVQFQMALDALTTTGGVIRVVRTGTYNFSNTVSRAIDNVIIEGVGQGVYFANDGVTSIFDAGTQDGWIFRDFSTDAGGVDIGTATTFRLENVTLGTAYYSGSVRSATYVVAASNSLANQKAQADYVCDGTADEVQIQAAIDALSSRGGTVLLAEGTYTCSENVTLDRCTDLVGASSGGGGTAYGVILDFNAQACNGVVVPVTAQDCSIVNIGLRGSAYNNGKMGIFAAGDGLFISRSGTNLFQYGIYFDGMDSGRVRDSWFMYSTNCVYMTASGGDYGTENQIDWLGGGATQAWGDNIYIDVGGYVQFNYCELNSADIAEVSNGWAVHNVDNAGPIYFEHCYIWKVNGAYYGEDNCTVFFKNNFIWDMDDYIAYVEGSDFIFVNNSTYQNPDGIYIEGDIPIITENKLITIANNGVTFNGTSNGIVKDNIFWNISGTKVEEINGATNNLVYRQCVETFLDVLANSSTYIRSNEDLSAAVPITFTIDAQPDHPRTISYAFDAHANITAFTIVVTGVNSRGETVTETYTESTGWSKANSSNAFATITSIIMTERTGTGVGDTMDFGISDWFGLSSRLDATADVYKVVKNGTDYTGMSKGNPIKLPTPNANDDFTVYYKSFMNTGN